MAQQMQQPDCSFSNVKIDAIQSHPALHNMETQMRSLNYQVTVIAFAVLCGFAVAAIGWEVAVGR